MKILILFNTKTTTEISKKNVNEISIFLFSLRSPLVFTKKYVEVILALEICFKFTNSGLPYPSGGPHVLITFFHPHKTQPP